MNRRDHGKPRKRTRFLGLAFTLLAVFAITEPATHAQSVGRAPTNMHYAWLRIASGTVQTEYTCSVDRVTGEDPATALVLVEDKPGNGREAYSYAFDVAPTASDARLTVMDSQFNETGPSFAHAEPSSGSFFARGSYN